MNNTIRRSWNMFSMVNIDDLRGTAFEAEDGGHTFEISGIDKDGNITTLSGAVAAVFLRPDNTDVAIAGTINNGKVCVTLTDECYGYPGRFALTIFLTSNGHKTAIYAAIGNVHRTSSGAVSPEVSESVVDLINDIEAARASIPADYSDLWGCLAPVFNSSNSYKLGQYVTYDGNVYRFNQAHSGGWNSNHVTQVTLGGSLTECVHGYGSTNYSISSFVSAFGNADGAPKQSIMSVTTSSGVDMTSYGFPVNSNGVLTTMSKTGDNASKTGTYQFFFASNGNYYMRLSYSGTYNQWIRLNNIDSCMIGSGKYINSAELLVAPYDDLDTIPSNTIISYAGADYFPDNIPEGFRNSAFTVVSFSRSTNHSVTSITFQILFGMNLNSTPTLYLRASFNDPVTWSSWIRIQDSVDIDKLQTEINALQLLCLFNLCPITESNETQVREVVITSNTDGTIKLNGTVTSQETAYRTYSIYGTIDGVTKTKYIHLLKNTNYVFGFEYISGDAAITDVSMLVKRHRDGETIAYTTAANANRTKAFSVGDADEDVEIRIIVHKDDVYSNFVMRMFLKKDDIIDSIHITPSMFSKIGVIGDSFASGVRGETGTAYEYSWIQMMAREYGCTAHNFCEGGLTTRTWLTSAYGKTKLENTEACNLYFVALGINDSNPDARNVPIGTISDMDETNPPDTFYGNMKKIRDCILSKNEHAVICYITAMRISIRYTPYQTATKNIAEKYGCLLVDWRDVPLASYSWWSDNIVSLHPTVPMYNTMMHIIVDQLSNAIRDNMGYMTDYPYIDNT